jgi:hypothetical protein
VVGGAVLFGLGAVLPARHAGDFDHIVKAAFVWFGVFWSMFSVVVFLHLYSGLMRVHEHGLSQRLWGRMRSLRYDEIDRFLYSEFTFHTSTYYLLHFFPAKGSGKRPLRFLARHEGWNTTEAPRDNELERLRDRVYQMLVARRLRQLQAGRPVEWTDRLRLLPEGLEYRPRGKSGGADRRVYPYASITRVELTPSRMPGRKKLLIFVGAEPEPRIVAASWNQPDFVPGRMLLDVMRQPRPGQR